MMIGHNFDPPVNEASLRPGTATCTRCGVTRTVEPGGQVVYTDDVHAMVPDLIRHVCC